MADPVREAALVPGCPEHVALWDAINAYSAACGGHPTRGGGARMDAVVRVEAALRADYDALVARVEKLRDEGFAMYAAYHAALKQRDEARALLREARGCVAVNYGPNEFSRLLARIDRCLEDKA